MSTQIDLRSYEDSITEFLSDSVERFASEHAGAKVSAMGIFCSSFPGYFVLAFDTREHSDLHVQEFQQNGPEWFGEDPKGTFCDNPPDFAFQFGEFEFPGFPDLHEVDPSLSITTLDGSIQNVHLEHDGDEGLNEVIFPFLLAIIERFQGYLSLNREPIFRIGVCMHDSTFEKFWLA